jgi:hypothetical protein
LLLLAYIVVSFGCYGAQQRLKQLEIIMVREWDFTFIVAAAWELLG